LGLGGKALEDIIRNVEMSLTDKRNNMGLGRKASAYA
jgi:hypothetical protein